MAATTDSTMSSAIACISASVRSCTGCGVNAVATSNPRARDWAVAASRKGSEATTTPGSPRRSRSSMSCTLHVVHEPQSASASITASHWLAISWRRSTGAGLVNVGLI